MTGWIKLHRKILDNGVFADAELLKIYIWCILKANRKEAIKNVYNAKLKQGQFLTGRVSASEELYIKPSSVHNRLKRLQDMGYIKLKSTNKYTIITVVKFKQYQVGEEQPKMNVGLRQIQFTSEAGKYWDKYTDDMIKEFVQYWTETNPSKTKMRFELQKTFDIGRRLANWYKNSKNFKSKEKSNILDTWQEARNIINNG